MIPAIKKLGRGLWETTLRVLYPQHCVSCEEEITRAGDYLCFLCREEIAFIHPPFCYCCGKPAEITYDFPTEDFLCGDCRTLRLAFDKARAMGSYEPALRKLILHFKYRKQPAVMNEIAPLMRRFFSDSGDSFQGFQVSPIPLHVNRTRERGFDQAYLIARKTAEMLDLPFVDGLLARVRETEPQALKTKAERAKNIKGAFQAVDADKIKGRNILIVDDVFTTGATVNEAAKILKRAKANRVIAFTLARA